MSRKAKKGQWPEATAFMLGAMRRVGAATVPELAEKTGLDSAKDIREFYKWYNGENRPLVTKVLPLMRATGMINGEDEPAAGPAPDEAAVPPTQQILDLAAAVDRQTVLLEGLGSRFDELAKLVAERALPQGSHLGENNG